MARTRARPTLPLLLALVAAVILGPGGAQVSIQLSEAFLPRGASLRVNCSSSCSEGLDLGLETQWSKVELEHGHNWKLFELSDIEEDSNLMCFGNCGTEQFSASATIILYSFPERVELDPLPAWQQVGKILTLRCLVDGGAPRSQLSVVFFQGEEELHRKPVGVNSTNPKEITTTVLASRDNHGANFSCRTELDLRPQGLEVFLNVSEARQLRTFDLPGSSPKLNSPDLLEVGTLQKVLCRLEGLFPASEAQLHLELGGHILTSKSTNHGGDSVSATALVNVTAELEGTQQLRCVLELADQNRQAEKTVNIYNFSAPVLTLSPQKVSEGSLVTAKCEAHGGAQEVRLSGAPSGAPSPQVSFTLNASAADDQREFVCSAALKVAGQKLLKNQTQKLHVLYGPWLDEGDCPGNWTWPEKSQQTLKCEARGNPSPKLTCNRKSDDAPLPIGVVTVTREMSGIYVCQATSSCGNVTKAVSLTVTVISNPPPPEIVFPVITLLTVLLVGLAIYLYIRQRKIRIYKLQRAQEEAMKLKAQAPPP